MNSYNLLYFYIITVNFFSFSTALHFVLAAPKNDEIWNMSQETLAEQSRFTSEKSPVFITTVEFPESSESPGRGRLPFAMVVVPDEKYINQHMDEYIKQINDEIVNSYGSDRINVDILSRPIELVASMLLNNAVKPRIPEYLESAAKLLMVLEVVEGIEFYVDYINDAITFSKWLNNHRWTSRNNELQFNFHALNLLKGTLFKAMGLDVNKSNGVTNVAKRIALIQSVMFPQDKFGRLLKNDFGGRAQKLIKQKLNFHFEKLTDAELFLVAKGEDNIFEPSLSTKESVKPSTVKKAAVVEIPPSALSPNPNREALKDVRSTIKCRYGNKCKWKSFYCPYNHENFPLKL